MIRIGRFLLRKKSLRIIIREVGQSPPRFVSSSTSKTPPEANEALEALAAKVNDALKRREYKEVTLLLDKHRKDDGKSGETIHQPSPAQDARRRGGVGDDNDSIRAVMNGIRAPSSLLPLNGSGEVYQSLMRALVDEGLYGDALTMMKEAGAQRIKISRRTYMLMLRSLEKRRRWQDCIEVLQIMRSLGDPPCNKCYMIAIDCLTNVLKGDHERRSDHIGRILRSICIDETMSIERKSKLCGYGLRSIASGEICEEILQLMRSVRVPVNEVHLGCTLKAWADEGDQEECRRLLEEGQDWYRVKLNVQHINLTLLALSRTSGDGSLSEDAVKVYYMLEQLGLRPSEYTISYAIVACAHAKAWPVALMLYDEFTTLNPTSPSVLLTAFKVMDDDMLALFGPPLYKRAVGLGVVSCWKDREGLLVDLHGHSINMARVALGEILKEIRPEEVMSRNLKIITGRGRHTVASSSGRQQNKEVTDRGANLLSSFVRSYLEEKFKEVNQTDAMYDSSPGCLAIRRRAMTAILTSST